MRTHSPGLNPSCAHPYAFGMTSPSPYLRTYLMDGPTENSACSKFFQGNIDKYQILTISLSGSLPQL